MPADPPADLEAVGLFDERFFLYTEDVDLCASIRARGRRVLFVADVEIVHLRGRSAASAPAATEAAYRQSQIAFYEKHHPAWVPWLRRISRCSGEDRSQQMSQRLISTAASVLVSAAMVAVAAQSVSPLAATPAEPISQIAAAFRTHNVVTISDPHGNVQVQAFILSLIRDPRFRDIADDVVLETANSRYQDAIDRYVRGEDVSRVLLRRAWEDHTVVNSFGAQAQELIEAVRAVNSCKQQTKASSARR